MHTIFEGVVMEEYSSFVLVEADNLDWPLIDGSYYSEGTVMLARGAGFSFRCATENYYPDVTIRMHAVAPRPEKGSWDHVEVACLPFNGSLLILQSITSHVAATVEITPGVWCLRCHVRGREAARRQRAVQPEGVFHGIEVWLLDLWKTES